MKKNNLFLIIMAFSGLILSGCSSDKAQQDASDSSLQVEMFKPIQKTKQQTLSSGYIVSNDLATIGTRMMGRVEKVYVKKGQQVKKGHLLLSISDDELKAKLTQAKANEEQAKAAFNIAEKDEKRYADLLASKSISQKEYEQVHLQFVSMKANLEAAKAMVKEVKANRAYTQIKAPFSGLISSVSAKEGMLANPGFPLVVMERKGDLVVQTQVNERTLQSLKEGDFAEVTLSDKEMSFKTTILELSRSSIATGGNYLVTLAIEKSLQAQLISGMHVQVAFEVTNATSGNGKSVFIPSTVIIEKGGLKGVYVLNPNHQAVLRWLRLGKRTKTAEGLVQVEVLSGLSVNDTVLVPSKEYRLSNGIKVTPKQ